MNSRFRGKRKFSGAGHEEHFHNKRRRRDSDSWSNHDNFQSNQERGLNQNGRRGSSTRRARSPRGRRPGFQTNRGRYASQRGRYTGQNYRGHGNTRFRGNRGRSGQQYNDRKMHDDGMSRFLKKIKASSDTSAAQIACAIISEPRIVEKILTSRHSLQTFIPSLKLAISAPNTPHISMKLLEMIVQKDVINWCSIELKLALVQSHTFDEQDSWYRLLVDLMDIIAKISNFSACTKEVLRSSIGHVTNVLNHIKFFIPDSNNFPIFNLLKEKDKELETLLQQKADEVSDESGNEQTEYVKSKSIFPDMSDFKDDPPKLIPIKTKDGYENFREYMHIQYSLLREDFVGPLRDEIRRYCKEAANKTSANKHKYRYNDIRVYDQVRIVSLVFDQGVNYVVKFDTSTLRKIQWTTSGRLKYGTLVCLSPDNFQTMLVGVVCDSDPSARSKGYLHLKFDPSINDQTIREAMQMTHTMIEAVNYFEAYKHVLLKCKELSQSDLAMLRYVIYCEKRVLLPTYLRKFPKPTFDLRSLADPNFKVKGINRFEPYMKDDDLENSYVHPRKKLGSEQNAYSSISDLLSETELQDDQVSLVESVESMDELSLEKVNIVDDEIPETALRRFDKSQIAAVKNALKDEISIIQGPPGCGKTFVGKEIIKVLLNNQVNWRQGVGGRESILVLCYTNHALDQFMEGICEFYDGGVLRVGGRSRSDKLKSRNLSNLRSNMRKARSIPDYIYKGRKSERGIMHSLRNERKLVTLQIQCLRENIIHEHSLYEEMGPDVAKQFEWKRNEGVFRTGTNCSSSSTSMICDWLCIEEISKDVDYFIQQNGIEQIIAMDSQQQHRDESDEFPDLFTHRYHALPEEDFKFNDSDINDKLNDFTQRNVALKVADIERKPENVTQQHWDILRWSRLELSKRIRDFLRRPSEITQDPGPGLNIYYLRVQERWDLYNYWVNKKCSKLTGEIENNMSDYKSTHGRYEEVLMLENEFIMRMADVIGMTTTCAAKHSAELQSVNPSIIIVEEAAEIFESHLVTNISKGCQQLILIGDHKQLRPKPNNYKLEKGFNLDVSLFERLIMSGIKYTTLSQQHRMRPLIAENVRKIYPHVFDHPDVKCYDDVKGMGHNMVFLKHCHNESADGSDSKSHRNPFEAAFSIRLARYLVQQGYSPDKVTILTTYKGQMFDIMRLKRNEELLQGMTVTVVDNFQGEESDIVILSLVRSNAEGKIGFLSKDNRVCVALSRAKIGLYVLGNFGMYNTKLWTSIITSPLTQSLVLPAIPLQCQNHPNTEPTLVSTAGDFDKVPGGGCTRPCEFDMSCGHRCYKSCHLEDKEHEKVKCIKPCERKCTFGHPCKLLCGDECKCTEKIEITPSCGHKTTIPCFKQIDYKCQEICGKQLPCGHNCRKVCHKPCGSCTERVTVILPGCGHSLEAFCHEDISEIKCMETCNCPLDCGHICREVCGKDHITIDHVHVSSHSKCIAGHLTVCNEKCNMKLACGHICSETCYECFQGRLHKPCQRKCQHKLICNHPCNGTCNSCVPCQLQCDRFCPHRRCTKKCYEICQVCMEPCPWSCKHYTCTKPCGEPCDRPRCNRRCPEVLNCGHKCIGLCGEPCLRFCPICRRKEFEENCFGGKQFPASSFVQLDDCGHAVQYKLLDEYFDDCSETTLRQCPICSTPIYHCWRYGAVLKRMLKHIDKMKHKLVRRTSFGHFRDISEFGTEIEFTDYLVSPKYSDMEKEFIDYLVSLNERNVDVLRYFIKSFDSSINSILENLKSSQATPSLQWRADITNEVYRACDHTTIDRIEQEIAEKKEATKQISTVRALILSRKPYTNTMRQSMIELERYVYLEYGKHFEMANITLDVQGINNKDYLLTYGDSQCSESSVELVPYEDQSNSPGTSILNDLFAVDDSSEEYQFVEKIQPKENCDVANDFGDAVDTNENKAMEAQNMEFDDSISVTVKDVHSLSMDEGSLQNDPIQNVADNDTPTDGQTIDSTLQNEKIKESTIRSTDRSEEDLILTYGTKTESKFETEKSGHICLAVVNEIVSDEVLVTEDECEQRKMSAQEIEINALVTTTNDIRHTDNSKGTVSEDDLTLAVENGSEEMQTSPREFGRDLAFALASENKQGELKKSPREFERSMTLILSSGKMSGDIKTSPREVEKDITLASGAENGSEEMQTSPREVGKDTSLLERQSTTSVKIDDTFDASSWKVDVFALPKKLVMYTTSCPEYYKCEKMAVPEEFKRIVRSKSHNVKESRKSDSKSSRDGSRRDDGQNHSKDRYKPRETGSERLESRESRKRDMETDRYRVTENRSRTTHEKNPRSHSRGSDSHKDNDIDNFENKRRHSYRNSDRRNVTENKNRNGDGRYNSSRGGIYRDTDRITEDRNWRTNEGHYHKQSNHKHSDRETVTEKQSGHEYSDTSHVHEKKRRHNDSDRENGMKKQSGYKDSDRRNEKEEENRHKDSDRESCTKKQRRHENSERRDAKEERSSYKDAGRSGGKEKRHSHKDLKRSIERENKSRSNNSDERGMKENKRSRPKHWERICDVEEQGRQESLDGLNLMETKNTEADSDRSGIIENQNIDKDGLDSNDTSTATESKTSFESQIEEAPNEDTTHKMVKKTMGKEDQPCGLATGPSDNRIPNLRGKHADINLAKAKDSENGQRKDCDGKKSTSNAVNTSTYRQDSITENKNSKIDMVKSRRKAYSIVGGETRTISTDYKSLLEDRRKDRRTKDITDLEQFG